jgi:2-oxoglutarate ferredoxin oxidoreductase subunit alpha
MSESIVTPPVNGGTAKVSKISEAVIRFAGNSQDGIQAIGGFLARLAGRSEQEVMTFMTIPATISGGPSIFQVRIGSGEVLSAGDEADVLVAFYPHSYEEHIGALRKGGIVLYDSDHVQPNPEWEKQYRHVAVPITSRTVEAIGGTAKDKGKNIFTLGLVAKMFDLNVPKLERLISERFGGKDESVVRSAMSAFHAGYGYSLGEVLETFQFREPARKDRQQVVMTGNEALAYGLIAAGIRFGAAYPITPWS